MRKTPANLQPAPSSRATCVYTLRVGVTSHDVARLAGVSQATVSRALRDDVRVTALTKQRVREAAQALGYVRSELGRGLSTQATHRVALVAELENTLYHQLMAPIHSDDGALAERLLDRSVDGAILMTTRLDSSLPWELSRRHLPFVFLNRVGGVVDAPSVTANNVGGARAAAHLLLELGHTRIGAILGPADTSTARDREAGYRLALEDAGIALPSKWLHRLEYDHKSGRRGFAAMVESGDPPTAILCASDDIAIGALNMALERGISVPDDIAVVGFDDVDMAAWPAFELTTVRTPLHEMARSAAGMLVDQLESHREVADAVFPTALVRRRTHART
jgi:LacI family transcriptional regulator